VVVSLIAKVNIDTMEPTIIFPEDGGSEERIALLTGIIQLVSAALEMSVTNTNECAPRFMKSERGVIGYCSIDTHIIICEGDEEAETDQAIRAVMSGSSEIIEKEVKKRGNEIGNLWR